ncbi:MAG: hypothetical protein GPJ00_23910 [Microcystis aeruginosa W13-18]|jgi:hypothetical protein|nr:hypothetical protein [Microcystis aeruginosa W13-18]NCR38248.1 hypothetical protein [Microcystis aeruginosa S11-05]NCR51754.1 hypothetical protein [Microcystis aeruginosa S11-01]
MSKNWDLEQEIVTYLDNLQGKINEVKQIREKAIQELDALLPSILVDILAAVKRTAIPHHATFLGWSRQRG